MRFIDTNLFLRYFTQDDEKRAEDVLKLLMPSTLALCNKQKLRKSIALMRILTK